MTWLGDSRNWLAADSSTGFDSSVWLRTGREWDESIGLLADPPPPIAELEASLVRLWSYLADLDEAELVVAAADSRDRAQVISLTADLPGSALEDVDLRLPSL